MRIEMKIYNPYHKTQSNPTDSQLVALIATTAIRNNDTHSTDQHLSLSKLVN